jgi:hypothetical protein
VSGGWRGEHAQPFNFLGRTLEENGHFSKDMRKIIALAKEAFINKRGLGILRKEDCNVAVENNGGRLMRKCLIC